MSSTASHPAGVHGRLAQKRKIGSPSLGIKFVLYHIVEAVAVQPRTCCIYLDIKMFISVTRLFYFSLISSILYCTEMERLVISPKPEWLLQVDVSQ